MHTRCPRFAPQVTAIGGSAVIEMSVRAVKRAGEDRLVAVLERGEDTVEREGQRSGRLLITVSRPEAHMLYHELRAERTLPGQTFELMAQVVAQLSGKLTAVELIADDAGKPSARLRLERTDGRSSVPTRTGQALALAVHLKVPLLVAEALLSPEKARAATGVEPEAAAKEATAKAGAVEVPEVFLRAFDE